jgi:uncharacterized protein YbcI
MAPSDGGRDRGKLNSAIANAVVGIMSDLAGRGPTRSRAFVHDDVVVCLLEETLSKVERNLVAAGDDEAVRKLRDSVQRAAEDEMIAVVERLTGRRVASFISGTSTGADASVEVFVLEPAG